MRRPELTFSRYEKRFVGSKERIFISLEEEKGFAQIWNGGKVYNIPMHGYGKDVIIMRIIEKAVLESGIE